MNIKHTSEILTLLTLSRAEISEIIRIYERTPDYHQVSQKIHTVLGLMRKANNALIRYHLKKCVPQLLSKTKTAEGIKQIVLSYKYLRSGGI